jgi:hypothetical protein
LKLRMTLRECANQLGCSLESARQLCVTGQLAYTNVGTGERQSYRVHVDDFQRFLSKRHHRDQTGTRPRTSAVPDVPNLCGM